MCVDEYGVHRVGDEDASTVLTGVSHILGCHRHGRSVLSDVDCSVRLLHATTRTVIIMSFVMCRVVAPPVHIGCDSSRGTLYFHEEKHREEEEEEVVFTRENRGVWRRLSFPMKVERFRSKCNTCRIDTPRSSMRA